MAVATGMRGTQNVLADQKRIDIGPKVMELEPDKTPLLVFSRAIDTAATHNPDFDWLEDSGLPRFDRVNNGAGYLSTDTSVVVDTGTIFQPEDVVYVTRTGEAMRVTAVSTNTLTVTRGLGTSAAALIDNDELIIIGSAAAEGADDKAARWQNPTKLTNYTQIFRDPVEATETYIHTDNVHVPQDWDRQRNKKGIEHAKSIEYALLFGRPSKNTGGAQPIRTTGGAYNYATQNQTDAGGNLTGAELFSSLRPAFRYGSNEKLGLCSPLVVDVINGFPRSQAWITQAENKYGMKIFTVISPHGTLRLKTHWLLEGDKLANEMLILDIDQIKYRYLANSAGSRDTHVRENIQAPGADKRKDEYMTECGLVFGLPATHAKLTNVTS
jgi:hypothetical protein